jgi:DNA-binding transcriptional LysR family regulator
VNPAFDIDALRAVVAGIDLRSFARAAVVLGRSQSAISMQLKKLEHQAGTQLFVRKGRGLVPTEAGEALAAYARRIIALNDEAARAMGAAVTSETVRVGLPQDFFDDVMPATLATFASNHADVHVEVRAGPNHTLSEEIRAGRLDGAIVFFPQGAGGEGELLCELPMHWLAHNGFADITVQNRVPLVMFDHPCLFRQATLARLDQADRRWRVAVTTPSLPGIWGALRSNLGIAVRTGHGVPDDIVRASDDLGLPSLPAIELRLLRSQNATPAADDLCEALRRETIDRVAPH